MDDNLFINSARQIQKTPLDFYGFNINWYGTEMRGAEVIKNPPLASYYIAIVSSLFGEKEVVLHIAFMVFPLLLAYGAYCLARRFCEDPLFAALLAGVSPVCLVSSTNVMCDVMMLSFWVLAIEFWIKGIDDNSTKHLFLSSLFVVVCFLSKYFGIFLIPLLFVYALFKNRGVGKWLFFLVGLLILLVLYEITTKQMYGENLFLSAVFYAKTNSAGTIPQRLQQLLSTTLFVGGAMAGVLFFFPHIISKRVMALNVLAGCIAVAVLKQLTEVSIMALVQGVVFFSLGAHVLIFSARAFLKNINEKTLILFLWIFGTFAFCGLINWTVSGRTILPIVPAVSIVVTRLLDGKQAKNTLLAKSKYVLLFASISISFLAAQGDYLTANTSKEIANTLTKKYAQGRGTLYFQGHWGFQYYMEKHGNEPLDYIKTKLKNNDFIVVPMNNTNLISLKGDLFRKIEIISVKTSKFASTMNSGDNSGFYSSAWGMLPFSFGPASEEKYIIYRVVSAKVN